MDTVATELCDDIVVDAAAGGGTETRNTTERGLQSCLACQP